MNFSSNVPYAFDSQCVFGNFCTFGVTCSFGQGCTFGNNCVFGHYSSFGANCYFGYCCSFSDGCEFGKHTVFKGHNFFSQDCIFDSNCTFEGGYKAKLDNPYFAVDRLGSKYRKTYFFNFESGIYVRCGCFFGNTEEFIAKVKADNDNRKEKTYMMALELAKVQFEK